MHTCGWITTIMKILAAHQKIFAKGIPTDFQDGFKIPINS